MMFISSRKAKWLIIASMSLDPILPIINLITTLLLSFVCHVYHSHLSLPPSRFYSASYALPVQYEAQVTASHRHTRTSASIFDVSHMGQVRLVGDDRVAFIESLCVMDVASAKPNLAKLSVLVNENGGVIDDCMVTPRDDGIYIVLNAGCKNKDMAHINNHIQRWNKEKPSANPLRLDYFEDRYVPSHQT